MKKLKHKKIIQHLNKSQKHHHSEASETILHCYHIVKDIYHHIHDVSLVVIHHFSNLPLGF